MDKTPTPTTAVAEAPQEDQKKDDQVPSGTKEHQGLTEADIPFPSCRFVFVIMGFCGFYMVYSLRVNISLAIMSMSNTTYVKMTSTGKKEVPECPAENKTKKPDGPFEFDTTQQTDIAGSFYWGYIVLQIPAGTLAQMIGGKALLVGTMFITSVLTLLIPPIAWSGGYPGLLCVRIFIGLAQGASYPVMHVLVAKWSRPEQRSKMITFIYAGSKLGIVGTTPMVGALCSDLGWESAFYMTGGLGLLWSFLAMFLIYDDPGQHPRISPKEYQLIVSSQGQKPRTSSFWEVPWRKMFTSPPVLALITVHLVYNWSNFSFSVTLPQYFGYVLGFDIKANGFLSSLPYLAMWVLMLLTGVACDFLMTRNLLSITNIRKLMISISFLGGCAFIIGTGFVICNNALAVALFTISIGLTGVSWGGWSVNHVDLAPPFAGTLMGMSNGISTISGIVGPKVVAYFTENDHSRKQWLKFFYLTGAIDVFGTIVYLVFGSGKRQAWGYLPSQDTTNTETSKTDTETATPGTAADTPPAAIATPPPAIATPPPAIATPPPAIATPPAATATPPAATATPPAATAMPATATATPPARPIMATARPTPATAMPATATATPPARPIMATARPTPATAMPATPPAMPTMATARPTPATAMPATATAMPTMATARPTTATAMPAPATARPTMATARPATAMPTTATARPTTPTATPTTATATMAKPETGESK